ncbi:MAG: tRNA dihydrouridine synthase DusB [Peptococcaceae bacterium]|jgi:nifR3 family TIM-barrel protein|nr:tRNA dihydrouridine synthase DusB [Peptococcaceae bacterium]MBQ2034730.1 tRNA dihydrouridine synthase DusB [Peptococcaceae bacterium]MBQ5682231.1 tRNA dihydrouridine synthase DusB [Peptococcaceae bacterium]MBQ5858960.1 tRNA dihydrouridine synthase DusB [Peptococcaceae bacterium]
MNRIKQILNENPVVAAPMAGISDRPSRLIAREYGCGLVYTEMISAKALTYKNQKTYLLMNMEDEVQPVNMQIFGSEPDVMAEGARIMQAHGAQIIDINMGCPVPKVVNNGEGSSLMRNPELAAEIVEAMVKAVDVPITVKFRKGWDDTSVNAVEYAKRMEAAGVSAIAVHGRTRMQYYSGKADWEIIRQVKEAVQVPVIGNGDLFEPEDGKKMMEETGCDGIMLGRGALGRPWMYQQTLDYLRTGMYQPEPALEQRKEVILHHARLICAEKGEYVAMKELRKHIAWYYKGLPNAARMRDLINTVSTMEELQNLLQMKF